MNELSSEVFVKVRGSAPIARGPSLKPTSKIHRKSTKNSKDLKVNDQFTDQHRKITRDSQQIDFLQKNLPLVPSADFAHPASSEVQNEDLFTIDLMTTSPVSPEIHQTLREWKAIAETFKYSDPSTLAIINNLISHAENPDRATSQFSYEISLSASKFVVVRGGHPQRIQSIAFVVQTKSEGCLKGASEPLAIVGDVCTAPWNRPMGSTYAKQNGITPVRGAGTACLAACARLHPQVEYQAIALKSLDSAIAFYRKIGFTVVPGNRLWGLPMELSAAKAAEQFKNVIYKM
jgi:hypothetical protein